MVSARPLKTFFFPGFIISFKNGSIYFFGIGNFLGTVVCSSAQPRWSISHVSWVRRSLTLSHTFKYNSSKSRMEFVESNLLSVNCCECDGWEENIKLQCTGSQVLVCTGSGDAQLLAFSPSIVVRVHFLLTRSPGKGGQYFPYLLPVIF